MARVLFFQLLQEPEIAGLISQQNRVIESLPEPAAALVEM